MAEPARKLYRSKTNKVFAGVCGGLGDYFNIDPVLLRLVWVIAAMLMGLGLGGLVVYIIAAIIVPIDPGYIDVNNNQ
ncbi:MAG: PspC domain-containing protein [Firmicutes bacterium]|nr:PspC domain-containing protein [Bacillota bacterium]MBQ3111920.1 PspC domain-containing protein [Bacillota bacterium]MBQ6842882.1 PspC domain-containing protein [Bacillota bacterium]MBR6824124.1 PspC domain-containing protein [Bacillota bacterium]MBR7113213.1 PspC domain-containing protein [Bacillota bacterium]